MSSVFFHVCGIRRGPKVFFHVKKTLCFLKSFSNDFLPTDIRGRKDIFPKKPKHHLTQVTSSDAQFPQNFNKEDRGSTLMNYKDHKEEGKKHASSSSSAQQMEEQLQRIIYEFTKFSNVRTQNDIKQC